MRKFVCVCVWKKMTSIVSPSQNDGGKDKNDENNNTIVNNKKSDDNNNNKIETELLEGQETIGGIKLETYKRLRPTGQALAQIFEDAKRRDEAPEEEPVYYWDDDFEGNPDELEAKEKVWHNIHSMGYSTFKGMEFAGEIAANFFGLNQSKYQWIIDAKKKEEAEKERALLEYRQRKWLLEQRKLKREKERRENMEEEIVNDADALEGGGGGEK